MTVNFENNVLYCTVLYAFLETVNNELNGAQGPVVVKLGFSPHNDIIVVRLWWELSPLNKKRERGEWYWDTETTVDGR